MTFPNQLTVLRILLTPVFVWLALADDPYMKLWAVVVFAIASLTDVYDGYHARKYGVETRWGAFMDPLADKILITSAFLVYVAEGYVALWMVLVIAARDTIVTILRVYAEVKDKPIITSKSAKIKTFLQNIYAYVMLLMILFKEKVFFGESTSQMMSAALQSPWVEYTMLGLTLFTMYTGFDYLIENWHSLRAAYLGIRSSIKAII
ncbi:MAG: CDP-diacylglycerol--glycerol-3-phosphate 3-phosphatidyltransferase [Chlorobiales bacterium]|nr:CDP-diacylglycerol--glycerol-3-phosphate 3-phosphatidyltransferase [Chlorobiales bacterium]